MLISFNGLLMGDNTLYSITGLEGDDSLPDLSIGMVAKPRTDGSWLGAKLRQKRVITINFDIWGDPANKFYTAGPKARLARAFDITQNELPLIIDQGWGEEPFMVKASVTALELPKTTGYQVGHRSGTVEFTCTDTKKYKTAPLRAVVPPRRPAPAVNYGAKYGFKYHDSAVIIGPTDVFNDGTSESDVVYTIKGPAGVPGISLADSTGARGVTFDLALDANDVLTLDTKPGTALLNGSTDVLGASSGALISDLKLAPGRTRVSFTSNSAGGIPELAMDWLEDLS